ncbi:MAG: TolC family protein [Pirellulales bacterium]|nr:TolC family protein [Pirellulales bacterium]
MAGFILATTGPAEVGILWRQPALQAQEALQTPQHPDPFSASDPISAPAGAAIPHPQPQSHKHPDPFPRDPLAAPEYDDSLFPLFKSEQRRIRFRDPANLPDVYIPPTAPPPTVERPRDPQAQQLISLDEAIRLALANSEVIRVLAGTVAVSSGSTIYDPAITNTTVDQQRARFDPALSVNNTFTQSEPPVAFRDPLDPDRTRFGGIQTQNHNLSADLSQTNLLGGTSSLGFFNDASQFSPGVFPLNAQNSYSTGLSYTQPLLRGAGVLANRVPVVLTRIDTERSFFQLRDSLQELVRGVIEAYWALVFARTDLWAREMQVRQAQQAFDRAAARQKIGIADISEVAQTRLALAQFKATVISARANVLAREAALANILGLPPTEPTALVPTTPPTTERIEFDWNQIVQIAQQRRPDIIELKLILEADQQRLLLARNQMQPTLDLVGVYRWNGLEGQMPNLDRTGTGGNDSTDWTMGVNFSVPLLLRQERAAVRSAEMVIARDRAALEQGVHSARHILGLSYRNLDQFYSQTEAYREAREAARLNLERQFTVYLVGQDVIFLNVLQAISDWGNSVSLQAQALSQYNIELASMERETGTILETHGVFLYEDRFCRLGPLWIDPKLCEFYPRSIHAGPNEDRYPPGAAPSEQAFNLDDYPKRPAGANALGIGAPQQPPTQPPDATIPPPEPLPSPDPSPP